MVKTNKLTKGKNVRWESMRMMLPEHVRMLNEWELDQMKVSKPALDEQEWELISQRLHIAIHNGEEITVKYYHEGCIEEVAGRLTHIDTQFRRMKLEIDGWDIEWLRLDDILSVM